MCSVVFVDNGLKHAKSHVWSFFLKDTCPCSSFTLFPYRAAEFTAEMLPDVAAELLVSDAVDERAEQTRKHVGKQEAAEEDLGAFLRPTGDKDEVEEGRDEGQHANEQLDSVQQDGVSGVSG